MSGSVDAGPARRVTYCSTSSKYNRTDTCSVVVTCVVREVRGVCGVRGVRGVRGGGRVLVRLEQLGVVAARAPGQLRQQLVLVLQAPLGRRPELQHAHMYSPTETSLNDIVATSIM